ncbi:MAG: T9SS type A sorting domain-containing protein [Bacteroidales bacterium]|nr:T9SS type A sorting domain-containing protein [Bacteroidales bacterium]
MECRQQASGTHPKIHSYWYNIYKLEDLTDWSNLNGNWIVAEGEIVIENAVVFDPSATWAVYLILCDGAKVTFKKGLTIGQLVGLNIYSQSYGGNMGQLIAEGTNDDAAAIGGKSGMYAGNIVIHGGNIKATGGSDVAGIGGGHGSYTGTVVNSGFGEILIFDGIIEAQGGENAAGIGYGDDNTYNDTYMGQNKIIIYGGTITATGKRYGSGIGVGQDNGACNVSINGGNVTANNEADEDVSGKGIKANSITLGWTNATDKIHSSSYEGTTVAVTSGQALYYDNNGSQVFLSGTPTSDQVAALADKDLLPASIVNYIDANGASQSASAKVLLGNESTLAPGWYVATGTVNLGYLYGIDGSFNFILSDGAEMNVTTESQQNTIFLPNSSMNIYGQSAGTGKLNVSASSSGNQEVFAINCAGRLTINGGIINASATGGSQGSTGIIAGGVTINAGQVTATGSKYGIYASNTQGNITLGWRNTTDFIHASKYSSYRELVYVAENKTFISEDGNSYTYDGEGLSEDEINAIAGKTLYPNSSVVVRTIEGYGTGNDKWAFIASPVVGSLTPDEVGNLLGTQISNDPALYNYDLYRLNNTIWENYHAHDGFTIANGTGYLYATKEQKNLVFRGEFNTDTEQTLSGLGEGWNLVGNPFTTAAYINMAYYTLNSDGSAIVAQENSTTTAIAPCTGVIVQVNESQTVIFSTTSQNAANQGSLQIALAQANTRGNAMIDNAIVSFNEGAKLGKFYFGTQAANVYLPQGGEDYAIAYSEGQVEMPLNFKATKDGEYTLSIAPEGVEMNYLHLIDNMTGADVDLIPLLRWQGGLNEPATYTFTAKTTDYASRFKLVFSAEAASGDACEPSFAFINNGNIIVNGEGTLQMVDVTGRVIRTVGLSQCGSRTTTSGMAPGVYVLRLVNGNDVKTQKIVIE